MEQVVLLELTEFEVDQLIFAFDIALTFSAPYIKEPTWGNVLKKLEEAKDEFEQKGGD